MRSFLKEFRDGLRAVAPGPFPYARFAAALALGTAGGWTFAQLNLPLAWMLGAMTVCTFAALIHAPIAAPAVVRPPMTMVIGVLLGAGSTRRSLRNCRRGFPPSSVSRASWPSARRPA